MGVAVGLALLPGLMAAESTPTFKEVYDLLKTNLVNTSETDLDRAATEGLLRQLNPRASWVGSASNSTTNQPLLARSCVFDGFGYVRIARADAGLSGEMRKAIEMIQQTNQVSGWVLDLRFAGGFDYQTAADLAEMFVAGDRSLLDWGRGMVRTQGKTNALNGPILVLINHQTSGAAEALAAVLRQTDTGLVLGTNSAGQAFTSREFSLTNGQRLRIATGLVKTGDGHPLPVTGVKPDILVAVSAADEMAYLDDPYKVMVKTSGSSTGASLDPWIAAASTNRAGRRRLNEAELVKMQRDGLEYDEEGRTFRGIDLNKPVVRDPVLGRALDLLKGLAVVRRIR